MRRLHVKELEVVTPRRRKYLSPSFKPSSLAALPLCRRHITRRMVLWQTDVQVTSWVGIGLSAGLSSPHREVDLLQTVQLPLLVSKFRDNCAHAGSACIEFPSMHGVLQDSCFFGRQGDSI
jgi:hypothetical protein